VVGVGVGRENELGVIRRNDTCEEGEVFWKVEGQRGGDRNRLAN